jgi:CheY-like chemotaxis protein
MSEAQSPPGSVLLVDDDPFILREYGKLLERLGLNVSIAENGKMALEYVRTKPIDVIITDLAMPTMGGLPFLRSLRKIDLEIPVILITGSPNLESAVAAVEYGAFQYLTKPIAPEKLKSVVTRALTFRALDRLHRQSDGESMNPGLPDRAALEARFELALSRLWIAYQPIVSWTKKVPLAYEALVRSAEPTMGNPGVLFDAAEKLDGTLELGRAIRAKVAETMEQHPEICFFVNLNP